MSFEDNYSRQLSRLTSNSRPIITSLTILAEENPNMALQICRVIIDRFRVLLPNDPARLPTLYLVDSIMKNVGIVNPVFVREFGPLLYRWFVDTFQANNEQIRGSLVKLFGTWRAMPRVFAVNWIAAIDEFLRAKASVREDAPPRLEHPQKVKSSMIIVVV
jgi:pre-mRNA cleavage complex 2 protein Pcf11